MMSGVDSVTWRSRQRSGNRSPKRSRVLSVNQSQVQSAEHAASEKRLKFEKFLADLSAKFVALPSEQVDDEIRKALHEVLRFFRIDRISLLRLLPCRTQFLVTHNADATGNSPYPVETSLPVSLVPWAARKLADDRGTFSFATLDDLPAEAAVDKQTMELWKVRSGLYIPIAALRSSEYSLGISSAETGRTCPEEYIPRLRLLGELFVNALERSIGERALRESEARLRERLEEIERLKLQLEKENIYLREEIKTGQGFQKIVGSSDALQYVSFRVQQVAPTDATVLILGETGTGKGMVAHAIHELSARKDRPMITVNCAALPANLIESELFGREKGAFTGAHARQVGRFEVANGGTIFLDEIGEMPLELQSKLLRVLQEGEFERLGSPRTIKVDVRVIASTARDLKAEIHNSRFREDLFYRLNVFPITMPPLRMRREDIPQLVRHFVDKYARKIGRTIRNVPKAVIKSLEEYAWPGNVRELEHVIERAVITSTGPVLQLADRLDAEAPETKEESIKNLAAMEREHILKVLRKTRWKINGEGGAAALLNIHPSTLRFRIKKLGIERP
jgi:formate hydrogenlyase transcriptional activator